MAFDLRRLWPGGTAPGAAADRLVYHPVMSRVLLAVAAVIGIWWTADLAARGRGGTAVVFGLWTVAIIAALACLFWRPAVIVDGEAVELRNVVRDVRVPWALLEGIETRYTLTLLAGGRRHQSWAGSAPGRPSLTSRVLGSGSGLLGRTDHRLPDPRWSPGETATTSSSRDLGADSGAAAFMVEQAWHAWRERHPGPRSRGASGPEDAVRVRWNVVLPAIALAAALLAAVLTPVL